MGESHTHTRTPFKKILLGHDLVLKFLTKTRAHMTAMKGHNTGNIMISFYFRQNKKTCFRKDSARGVAKVGESYARTLQHKNIVCAVLLPWQKSIMVRLRACP